MAIFIVLQIFIQVYLSLVLYSHWKNASLPEKDGGVLVLLQEI